MDAKTMTETLRGEAEGSKSRLGSTLM